MQGDPEFKVPGFVEGVIMILAMVALAFLIAIIDQIEKVVKIKSV